jgi:hypothetical protein
LRHEGKAPDDSRDEKQDISPHRSFVHSSLYHKNE